MQTVNFNKYFLCKYTIGGRVFPNLDCWGFVLDFYKTKLNVVLPEFVDFSQLNMYEAQDNLLENKVFEEIKLPKNDCVCCFYKNGILHHVAIYEDGNLYDMRYNGFTVNKLYNYSHLWRFFKLCH